MAAGTVIEIEATPRRLADPRLGVGLLRPVGRAGPAADPVVALLPGPDLDPELRAAMADGVFTVDPRSDHVGVRLTGPLPPRAPSGERPSRGVPVGAVELPGAPGELIVLQRGRSLTAGYPVVAVVGSVAQDLVAQLRPGDAVRLQWSTTEEARARLMRQRALEQRIGIRIRNALAALEESFLPATAPPVLGHSEVE